MTVYVRALDAGGERVFTRYGDTDAEGRYRVEVLAPGRYRVWTEDPLAEFGAAEAEVVVNGDETTTADFGLYLVDGPHLGTLSGRVTDEDTGAPLEGIHVLAYGEDGHQLTYFTTTDAEGRYRFERMRGNYYVQAQDPQGRYIAEWWSEWTDSATSRSQASRVQVYDGRDVVGIDLALQPVAP